MGPKLFKLMSLAVIFFLVSCGNQQQEKIAKSMDTGKKLEKASPNDQNKTKDQKDKANSKDTDKKSETGLKKSELDTSPLGGQRPAKVYLPDNYSPEKQWPILFLLHGYGASGAMQNLYLGVSSQVNKKGFILVIPEGTPDIRGKKFWDATDWCCNFYSPKIDDVTYIKQLMKEAKSRFKVDQNKVYFFGHSNGGFMSYRMACELSEEVTAIVSLAGTSFLDPKKCSPKKPVSVLHVHGTNDSTIKYAGDPNYYSSAKETVERWAKRNECKSTLENQSNIGISRLITNVKAAKNCSGGSQVELWTIEGGSHIPGFTPIFTPSAIDWLLSKSK